MIRRYISSTMRTLAGMALDTTAVPIWSMPITSANPASRARHIRTESSIAHSLMSSGTPVEVVDHPFETGDYVRGHGRGLQDWDPADGDGVHVVMRRRDDARPKTLAPPDLRRDENHR